MKEKASNFPCSFSPKDARKLEGNDKKLEEKLDVVPKEMKPTTLFPPDIPERPTFPAF